MIGTHPYQRNRYLQFDIITCYVRIIIFGIIRVRKPILTHVPKDGVCPILEYGQTREHFLSGQPRTRSVMEVHLTMDGFSMIRITILAITPQQAIQVLRPDSIIQTMYPIIISAAPKIYQNVIFLY